MKPFDSDSLRARLARARDTKNRAEARAAVIEKRLKAADRKRETQMLCTLGRAWIRFCEEDIAWSTASMAFLRRYISRDTDVEALKGTAFDVTVILEPRKW